MTSDEAAIRHELGTPGPERILYVADAFRIGMSRDDIHAVSKIDPWFLAQIEDLIGEEQALAGRKVEELDYAELRRLKRKGFSDRRLGELLGSDQAAVRAKRWSLNLHPVYKRVDTCAAEFATNTAYMYSSYEEECESNPSDRKKVMVLGGGPNRIGQGLSSTTAACTRRWRCVNPVSKPSWSTATRKPCPPTTIPRTVCISSR